MFGLIRPIFFKSIVNAQRYVDNFLSKFLEHLHDDKLQQKLFQQDDAFKTYIFKHLI